MTTSKKLKYILALAIFTIPAVTGLFAQQNTVTINADGGKHIINKHIYGPS